MTGMLFFGEEFATMEDIKSNATAGRFQKKPVLPTMAGSMELVCAHARVLPLQCYTTFPGTF